MLTCDDPGQAEAACHALLAGGSPASRSRSAPTPRSPRSSGSARSTACSSAPGPFSIPTQARAAAAAGARFAVAPGTRAEVVHACADLGLPFFPGVATPTEVDSARALGCRTLKVFPAAAARRPRLHPGRVGPYPDVRFIPTGGVNADNLADFLAVPAVLACGGSWMCEPRLLREGRFDEIERLAREAVERGPMSERGFSPCDPRTNAATTSSRSAR